MQMAPLAVQSPYTPHTGEAGMLACRRPSRGRRTGFLLLAVSSLVTACSDEYNAMAPGGSTEEEAIAFSDHTSHALSPMSATAGQWSGSFPWINIAVHLSLLPDGRVLSFGRLNGGTPQVWDPSTGLFTGIPSPSLLFCAGTAFLPGGKLLVAGGHIQDGLGLPNSNLFDFRSNTWIPGPDMAKGRWYPTTTMLANGEVLVIAGTDQNGTTVMVPEVRMTNGNWRQLTSAARSLPYYPRNFLAPNGKVFYAGEQQQTWYLNTTGTGSWTYVADRVQANRYYGAAVMYRPGKILYAGGGDPPTKTAEVINLNSATPQWRAVGSMANNRQQLNLTMLPDGRVLATGGTSAPGFSNPAGGVHAAEVWDPGSETWSTWASNASHSGLSLGNSAAPGRAPGLHREWRRSRPAQRADRRDLRAAVLVPRSATHHHQCGGQLEIRSEDQGYHPGCRQHHYSQSDPTHVYHPRA